MNTTTRVDRHKLRTKPFCLALCLFAVLGLTSGCETLQGRTLEGVSAAISVNTVVSQYNDARTAVTAACTASECPEIHAGLNTIGSLITGSIPLTVEQARDSYLTGRAAYIDIREAVVGRIGQISSDDLALLRRYDNDVRNLDTVIVELYLSEVPDREEMLNKILLAASLALAVTEIL